MLISGFGVRVWGWAEMCRVSFLKSCRELHMHDGTQGRLVSLEGQGRLVAARLLCVSLTPSALWPWLVDAG